jgi:hypothetical protein
MIEARGKYCRDDLPGRPRFFDFVFFRRGVAGRSARTGGSGEQKSAQPVFGRNEGGVPPLKISVFYIYLSFFVMFM